MGGWARLGYLRNSTSALAGGSHLGLAPPLHIVFNYQSLQTLGKKFSAMGASIFENSKSASNDWNVWRLTKNKGKHWLLKLISGVSTTAVYKCISIWFQFVIIILRNDKISRLRPVILFNLYIMVKGLGQGPRPTNLEQKVPSNRGCDSHGQMVNRPNWLTEWLIDWFLKLQWQACPNCIGACC